jgi:hypothetical protein
MKTSEEWEKFLTPKVTQDRLISASLYITAFELLKESIVGRIRDFYSAGFDESGLIVSPAYESKVLSRNRSAVYASLEWLAESDVIDDADLEVFERLKRVRNRVAHELPSLVLEGADLQLTRHFQDAFGLLKKIEVWWVVNVEIPTNPDYDGQEVDEDGILPGSVLMLQLILEVTNGNAEFLNHYRKAKPNAKAEG